MGGESVYVKRLFFALFVLFFGLFILYLFYPLIISNQIIPKNLILDNINLYHENKVFINQDWSISIPKINLINIPIKDSIDEDILNNYIGHFPTTSYLNGNICLAAHNAGFSSNFFQSLPLLENGDEIEYNYYNVQKIYKVSRIYVVNEKDLYVLKTSDLDKLTLITCISGSPHQRLCVEAVFKE